MFSRILGKKKGNAEAQLDRNEEKAQALLRQGANVAQKIKAFTKKCDKLESDKEKYLAAAKEARIKKRDTECKRYIRLYKQSETDLQRYSNMIFKLDSIQSLVDIYLSTSDFLTTVQDANTLVENFGLNPEQAETIMDKTKDLQDLSEEIHAAVELDVGEEDYDDVLDMLDQEIASDKIQELPDGSRVKQFSDIRKQTVEKKKQKPQAEEEDDMASLLAEL